ncbi:hypothetical protein [Marinomonas sp. 2405UD68-3]|uniref:hypothetical protein n=1 Tax=Marinomonas sp. 2405UD68-3 TaxID=3391835 RepID=UPI0039C9C85D
MFKILLPIMSACTLIVGCSPLGVPPLNPIPEKASITQTITQDNQIIAELSERIGYKLTPRSFSKIEDDLEIVKKRALHRYSSLSPRDTALLNLTKMTFFGPDAVYNLRDVSLVISRGDSRIIRADDVDVRFSGISEEVRITYSENQLLWINGIEIGVYDPARKQIIDTKIESLKTAGGSISGRIEL